jgi:signal transduction histidine kinase
MSHAHKNNLSDADIDVQYLWKERRVCAMFKKRQKRIESQRLELLGSLTGGFAHDFNNFLSALNAYLTCIRHDSKDERVLENLDRIFTMERRMADILKSIVRFASAGKADRVRVNVPVNGNVNIEGITDEILAWLRVSFPKDIRISKKGLSEACYILGEHSGVMQILLNLCINSRDAMPGGGELSITLERVSADTKDARAWRLPETGEYICIRVCDTGTGIEEKIARQIFKTSFTTKENGSGMGLAIAQRLARAFGGSIRAESAPGRGTTMSVYLPLTAPPPQETS